ncbi:hypothetical protein [Sphaerisporangium fuscum]|uniref:hypothetical protein n=1 Tax=Sphaerisporangium fuscum TaxID=2835868 RepID=UPI001BDC526F|nr:hypothetical protein [Sphaerisporangium fuscum]
MHDAPQDSPSLTPDEAARVLKEIRASQARVVGARPWWPGWYTTGVALYVTGVQFLTEPGTPAAVMAVGLTILTVLLTRLIVALVRGNRPQPHRSLVTAPVVAAFTAWLLSAVAACLVAAIWLSVSGLPYARTYAGLGLTVYMALTGPPVARWITRHMAAKIEASG